MEETLLNQLGERRRAPRSTHARPPLALSQLDALVHELQVGAIEKSTSLHYKTGARDYIEFCAKHKIPLDPTPTTLARYIAYSSQYFSSGPKYLSGARHFLEPFYPDFAANRGHRLVQMAIAGAKKRRADPVRRKAALDVSHLQQFYDAAVSSDRYDDLLFLTILSCAFYACHRIGELVWKNDKRLQDWRKVVKRSSLKFSGSRASYHLPYHKADRFYQGTDILFLPQAVANPIALLERYVSRRDQIHGAKTALFLSEDGFVPTRSWFDGHFFKSLSRKEFGGHSPRAGGATFLARLGVSEDVIQAIGRWSSEAWKIYIRDNPTVRAELQLAHLRAKSSTLAT